MKHALSRTSPTGKGSPFIGTCFLCGKQNLKITAALEDCENIRGFTNDETLLEAIGPSKNRDDWSNEK